MVGDGKSSNGETLLSRLDVSPELIRSLKLGKTYEVRLRSALLDRNQRAYLADGLDPVLASPESGELELLGAAAIIKQTLVEIARWKATHPDKPFPEKRGQE
ncbi:MAG: hypothetical protein HYY93_06725 [Planctomycetes bacterium]|nr:hypothetical protein [Planctomycetota bacterium]